VFGLKLNILESKMFARNLNIVKTFFEYKNSTRQYYRVLLNQNTYKTDY